MLCAILACFHALILARSNLLALFEKSNLRKLLLKLHFYCFLCLFALFVKCHSSSFGGRGEVTYVTQMQPNVVHAEQAVAN